MKVLIIEDQIEKSEAIKIFLTSIYQNSIDISVRQSLRSGLKETIQNTKYDLIVLDMSMPNFDPSETDPIGGSPESFAGREFISQMHLRKIKTPVVVVTQYSTFEKGQTSLEDLHHLLASTYPEIYVGSVYYSSASDDWKKDLKKLLGQ